MPAQPGAGMPAKAAAPAAAAPSGASRWLGPVAGIAAGLGLAALLAHFGLPEGFASVLLIGLVVIGIVIVARWLLTRRAATGPMQYAGASGGYAPRIEPVLPGTPQKAAQAFDAQTLAIGFRRRGLRSAGEAPVQPLAGCV